MSILPSQSNITPYSHIIHSIREKESTVGDHLLGAKGELIKEVGMSLHLPLLLNAMFS